MIGESLSLGAGLKICRRLPPRSQVHTTAADGTADFFCFSVPSTTEGMI